MVHTSISAEDPDDMPLVSLLRAVSLVDSRRVVIFRIDTATSVLLLFRAFRMVDSEASCSFVHAVRTNLETELLGRYFLGLVPLMHHLVLQEHWYLFLFPLPFFFIVCSDN